MRTLLFLSIVSLLAASAACAQGKQPNILFICADDLSYSDQSFAFGEAIGELTAVSRLRARGVDFTNAGANTPLCSASRACMFSGRLSMKHGLLGAQGHRKEIRLFATLEETSPATDPRLDVISATRFKRGYVTLPEICKQAGYRTGHFGKGHVDREGLMLAHGCDVDYPGVNSAGPPGGSYFDDEGKHIDAKVASECIRFMRKARIADEPFYAQLWFYSVHTPFEAPEGPTAYWKQKYDDYAVDYSPTYGAMLKRFDQILNTVIDELEATDAFEDTIVVFTSDNGTNLTREAPEGGTVTDLFPARGCKATIWEGGLHVPLVICAPALPSQGVVCPEPASHVDVLPTLQHLALLPNTGQALDGESLLPYVYGAQRQTPTFAYFPQRGAQRLGVEDPRHAPAAVVYQALPQRDAPELPAGRWKLVKFYCEELDQTHRYELYRIDSDWGETIDQSELYPELVAYLANQLERCERRTGAVVPVPNPAYSLGL